eukprot:15331791-Ditylum_brightwellii.AAC.3
MSLTRVLGTFFLPNAALASLADIVGALAMWADLAVDSFGMDESKKLFVLHHAGNASSNTLLVLKWSEVYKSMLCDGIVYVNLEKSVHFACLCGEWDIHHLAVAEMNDVEFSICFEACAKWAKNELVLEYTQKT